MTSISVIKRINQHLNKLTVPQPSKKSKYAFWLYFPGKAHTVAAKSERTSLLELNPTGSGRVPYCKHVYPHKTHCDI